MTARHVLVGACRTKALIDGSWVSVSGWTYWYTSGHTEADADVATAKLAKQVSGHVFTIRTWSPRIGDQLAALGHPLGNAVSLNQGSVIEKGKIHGTPELAVRMLAAEGGSGSPLVDNKGNVVGILQLGLGSTDILGQRTSGVIIGIDLPSWWPSARTNLCKAYRYGGILGCPSSASPGSGTTTPPTRCAKPAPAADCHGLDFTFQDLSGLDLTGANFHNAILQGTNFSGDSLTNAHFENALMEDAVLRDANLASSFFTGADLKGATLAGSTLTYAFFDKTDLEEADFTGANLVGVNFAGADLRGATGLDVSFLERAATLCNTILPDGTTSGCP